MTKRQLNIRLPVPLLDRIEGRRLHLPVPPSKQAWTERLLEKGLYHEMLEAKRGVHGR
jgi:hypothetical protein